ncbi:MAG: hypothetical protein FWF60_02985 [Oscillospiraceae bacterium]|nr:hypothetical protein [Oscillospiraceae bacterium]
MKNEKLIRSIGDIADEHVEKAAPPSKAPRRRQARPQKKWATRLVPIVACFMVFLLGTTAFAAGYIQINIHGSPRGFYLRCLSPEEMAVADSLAQEYGAKLYFDGLKGGDVYQQYFSINKLVEYYNDEAVRQEAIKAITPFLASKEEKLSDAAAFALSVLGKTFDDPRILHIADGSLVFTLFNGYSDYGSYNQLWRVKDGELEKYMGYSAPHRYIRGMALSPDAKLFAVETVSNKSSYVVIYDVIEGCVSPELVDSARNAVAKDMGYAIQQQMDFENFSDVAGAREGGGLRWLDDSTLAFEASLMVNAEGMEAPLYPTAAVRYDFRQKQMECSMATEAANA